MNLREVREAAARLHNGWHSQSPKLLGDYETVCDFVLATIDPSPDEPITADWLREVWGFEKVDWSSRTYENGHAAMICWVDYWNYEDDDLNWPHNLTTRQQFCDLARCLGIPRKDGAK